MSTPQKPRSVVRTSDIYYAAYLKVAGVEFAGTVREGSRVFFQFVDQDGLDDLKLQYYNNVSKIPARPYAEEIKAMKSLTFL